MTNLAKRCGICGCEFSIRINESTAMFASRTTCSRSCGARLRWATSPNGGRKTGPKTRRSKGAPIEGRAVPSSADLARRGATSPWVGEIDPVRAKRIALRDEVARRMALKR